MIEKEEGLKTCKLDHAAEFTRNLLVVNYLVNQKIL
jgi:hypothetical protein